jgi:hypothetical protein
MRYALSCFGGKNTAKGLLGSWRSTSPNVAYNLPRTFGWPSGSASRKLRAKGVAELS